MNLTINILLNNIFKKIKVQAKSIFAGLLLMEKKKDKIF